MNKRCLGRARLAAQQDRERIAAAAHARARLRGRGRRRPPGASAAASARGDLVGARAGRDRPCLRPELWRMRRQRRRRRGLHARPLGLAGPDGGGARVRRQPATLLDAIDGRAGACSERVALRALHWLNRNTRGRRAAQHRRALRPRQRPLRAVPRPDHDVLRRRSSRTPRRTLEEASLRKLDRICRKLELQARRPPARDRHRLGRHGAARRARTTAAA